MDDIMAMLGIVMINILLSGDNALVIALASRNLPKQQKKQAMIWGSVGAIGLRIILTFLAVILLSVPYLQLAGGLLLFWIAVKLIADNKKEEESEEINASYNLGGAIQTIILADLIMSLDNVVAIAGFAKGSIKLLIAGLAISIPLIIWGSKLIGMLMERWPIIIVIGSVFLGWTAGEMVTADQKIASLIAQMPFMKLAIPGLFASLVVIIGKMLALSKKHLRSN